MLPYGLTDPLLRWAAASSFPEEEFEVPADQMCEPAITSMPVGVLVDLDEEERLIDWETEVAPSHPDSVFFVATSLYYTKPVFSHSTCTISVIFKLSFPLLPAPKKPAIPLITPPLAPFSPSAP